MPKFWPALRNMKASKTLKFYVDNGTTMENTLDQLLFAKPGEWPQDVPEGITCAIARTGNNDKDITIEIYPNKVGDDYKDMNWKSLNYFKSDFNQYIPTVNTTYWRVKSCNTMIDSNGNITKIRYYLTLDYWHTNYDTNINAHGQAEITQAHLKRWVKDAFDNWVPNILENPEIRNCHPSCKDYMSVKSYQNPTQLISSKHIDYKGNPIKSSFFEFTKSNGTWYVSKQIKAWILIWYDKVESGFQYQTVIGNIVMPLGLEMYPIYDKIDGEDFSKGVKKIQENKNRIVNATIVGDIFDYSTLIKTDGTTEWYHPQKGEVKVSIENGMFVNSLIGELVGDKGYPNVEPHTYALNHHPMHLAGVGKNNVNFDLLQLFSNATQFKTPTYDSDDLEKRVVIKNARKHIIYQKYGSWNIINHFKYYVQQSPSYPKFVIVNTKKSYYSADITTNGNHTEDESQGRFNLAYLGWDWNNQVQSFEDILKITPSHISEWDDTEVFTGGDTKADYGAPGNKGENSEIAKKFWGTWYADESRVTVSPKQHTHYLWAPGKNAAKDYAKDMGTNLVISRGVTRVWGPATHGSFHFESARRSSKLNYDRDAIYPIINDKILQSWSLKQDGYVYKSNHSWDDVKSAIKPKDNSVIAYELLGEADGKLLADNWYVFDEKDDAIYKLPVGSYPEDFTNHMKTASQPFYYKEGANSLFVLTKSHNLFSNEGVSYKSVLLDSNSSVSSKILASTSTLDITGNFIYPWASDSFLNYMWTQTAQKDAGLNAINVKQDVSNWNAGSKLFGNLVNGIAGMATAGSNVYGANMSGAASRSTGTENYAVSGMLGGIFDFGVQMANNKKMADAERRSLNAKYEDAQNMADNINTKGITNILTDVLLREQVISICHLVGYQSYWTPLVYFENLRVHDQEALERMIKMEGYVQHRFTQITSLHDIMPMHYWNKLKIINMEDLFVNSDLSYELYAEEVDDFRNGVIMYNISTILDTNEYKDILKFDKPNIEKDI